MNSNEYWLISILYENSIVDIIIIIDANDTNFNHENYMENNNIEYINSKLPSHIKSMGKIIRIQRLYIFDIIDMTK